MEKLSIGYFADGVWAHNAFRKIISNDNFIVRFICPRYDTTDDTLKKFAVENHIDYIKAADVNSQEFIAQLKKYACDIFVSMSFNQIFKQEIINLPRYKIINCHAGKLPFYRGRNILNWALINDEKDFGITVHYVDQGIDTGDIILQKIYPITDDDDYASLLSVAHTQCADVLYQALSMIANNQVDPIKQNDINPCGMYCAQRKVGDEVLDWRQTTREIFNFIRAVTTPGPCARAYLNGREMKIIKSHYCENAPVYKNITGAIINKNGKKITVKTGDSYIEIIDFKYDGKIRVGDRFSLFGRALTVLIPSLVYIYIWVAPLYRRLETSLAHLFSGNYVADDKGGLKCAS